MTPGVAGSAPRSTVSGGYMPQLDALRAFAVGGVLITHLYYTGEGKALLPWGYLGVRLFFVLSGFLITGILLDCKRLIESTQQSLGLTLRRFYIRRALRILPPFYLCITVVSLAGLYQMRQAVPWHLVYLSNYFYAIKGRWPHPGLHFWSLAVEEQFYLLWPCLILAMKREKLPILLGCTIALGPIYRAAAWLAGLNDIAITMLPMGCLDTLGAGALLALWQRGPAWDHRLRVLRNWAVLIGIPALVLISIPRAMRIWYPLWTIGQDTILALVFAALVGSAAEGIRGAPGKLLMMPPLRAIGKVSYGVYVYHIFLIYPFLRYGPKFHYTLPDGGISRLFIVSVLVMLVAAASWILIERPINELKRYWPYGNDRSAGRPTAAPAAGLVISTETASVL